MTNGQLCEIYSEAGDGTFVHSQYTRRHIPGLFRAWQEASGRTIMQVAHSRSIILLLLLIV
jgi:hypothetical protein